MAKHGRLLVRKSALTWHTFAEREATIVAIRCSTMSSVEQHVAPLGPCSRAMRIPGPSGCYIARPTDWELQAPFRISMLHPCVDVCSNVIILDKPFKQLLSIDGGGFHVLHDKGDKHANRDDLLHDFASNTVVMTLVDICSSLNRLGLTINGLDLPQGSKFPLFRNVGMGNSR